MQPVLAAIAAFVLYFVFLRFYARFLGNRIFKLDPDAVTPAHALKDGVDYVPSRKGVLFGHHFASIAGLAPMLGPALAVIWGWLPAMLWVVFGSVLIGAVHDFSALVVSMRHRGLSVGKIAENLIGKRAKALFLLIILFLICLVMGVFIGTVADLFTSVYYPQTVFPTFFLMVVAMVIGWLVYKRSASIGKMTVAGFVLQLIAIYVALDLLGLPDVSRNSWILILLAYAFSASVLPVWSERRELRAGHPGGAHASPRVARISVPHRARSPEHPSECRLPDQRSGARLSAVVLSLEQHPG